MDQEKFDDECPCATTTIDRVRAITPAQRYQGTPAAGGPSGVFAATGINRNEIVHAMLSARACPDQFGSTAFVDRPSWPLPAGNPSGIYVAQLTLACGV